MILQTAKNPLFKSSSISK